MTAGRRGYFPAHDCRIGEGVEADCPGACLCSPGGGAQDCQGAPSKADAPRQADREKLMAHGASTNSLELSGDTKLFDRVARKWNVDYAFYQTEPGKYLLFFKSGQADAMTACFSEYSRKVLDKAKSRQPTIPEQMKQAEQQLAKEKPPKENRAPAKSQDFVGRRETTERADFGHEMAEGAERSLVRRKEVSHDR